MYVPKTRPLAFIKFVQDNTAESLRYRIRKSMIKICFLPIAG